MRTFHQQTIAAAALLLAAAFLQVNAQVVGDIATSTDAAGGLYTGTIAADGSVPEYTPVPANFVPIGAAGGGAGVPTTIQTLQSISGYDPPPSTAIPPPRVPTGTVVSPPDIPGYTGAAAASGAGSGSSGQLGGSRPRLSSLGDFESAPLLLSGIAAALGAAIVLL
ncbi:hypothetical protein V8E36_001205 [Tilletia maclaganii]